MDGLRQKFAFEKGIVRFDGGHFRPLEAVDRWVTFLQPHFVPLGPTAQVLYQLPNDIFVVVEYRHCQLKRQGWLHKSEIWSSDKPPVAREVSARTALEFLAKGQQEVPKHFDKYLAPPAHTSLPPRPFSYWDKRRGDVGNSTAHNTDVLDELRTFINLAIFTVQALRDGVTPGNTPVNTLLRFFLSAIDRKYRVDPKHWWGDEVVPPSAVYFDELRWPAKSHHGREAIRQIRAGIGAPLAVHLLSLPTGDPDFPTAEEQLAAEQAVKDAIPDLELQIRVLKDTLTQLTQSEAAKERVAEEKKKAKQPPKHYFQAWWLSRVPEAKQGWIRLELRKLTGRNYHQGTISRMVGRVEKWIAKGNAAPAPSDIELPGTVNFSSGMLDLGPRSDGHTPRQRSKRVDGGQE
jgi:hypothetical protein